MCVLQLFLATSLTLVFAKPGSPSGEVQTKHWAVLVAGSNGFSNYRHQADICHAYHVLTSKGIAKENIITFMYDDIANNEENPFPGKIFNDYEHKDVYEGVRIDYKGKDVTPENFVRVLKGDESLKRQGKKVLESGSNDHVFVYFSDHGAPGLIAFPDDDLTATQLNNTLDYMFRNKRYEKMVLYIEACESGSMFHNILLSNINVYATTAANPRESSYATFCQDETITSCLADEYSYNWIVDTNKHNVHQWSLNEQYEAVKKLTKGSHVMKYGDLTMGSLKLDEFQGTSSTKLIDSPMDLTPAQHQVSSRDAHMHYFRRKVEQAQTEHEKKVARKRLARAMKLASLVDETVAEIMGAIEEQRDAINWRPTTVNERLTCFETIYKTFGTKCFRIQQVPEVASHLIKFDELCNAGIDASLVTDAIMHVCS